MVCHTNVVFSTLFFFFCTSAFAVPQDASRFQYKVKTEGKPVTEEKLTVVNLDLLKDEDVAKDIEEGVQEEFEAVDEMLGDKLPNTPLSEHRKNRQMALIYRGVYTPDARFNAFVDGVMVNMVAEMKRRRMDPLYFRVHSRGIVEHVPTRRRTGRMAMKNKNKKKNKNENEKEENSRGDPIGGGVIKGLSKIKRFGNGEVQMAGNSTLIRAHWLCGPIDIIIDYRGESDGVTRVRTGLQAIQLDTLTLIDRFGADMENFKLISPLFEFMNYVGNRTAEQQKITEQVIGHLFTNNSFMAMLLEDAYALASYDKIIPQFGADSSYYSVLEYLLQHRDKLDASSASQSMSSFTSAFT